MEITPNRDELITSLIASLVGIAGSYAITGNDLDFIVAPVNLFVVNSMPAPILAFSIQVFGDLGKYIGFFLSLLLTVSILTVVTLTAIRLGDKADPKFGSIGLTYFFGWCVAALLTGKPFVSLGTSIPMAIVVGIARFGVDVRTKKADTGVSRTRRNFVAGAIGLCFSGLAYAIGHLRTGTPTSPLSVLNLSEREKVKRHLSDAEEKSLDVNGIPGLVSKIGEFYEVDINTLNPDVDVDNWDLSITGEVKKELTLTYEDITSMDVEHRYMTLRCVGEHLNAEKMDNALWTGLPMKEVLKRANPQGNYVMLHAVDGYYEGFSLDALENGFLAFGMNGKVLPRRHGYPVRALIPGHWGEISVKWLNQIEVLEQEELGYWEKKGWHGTGPVNTIAKIWTVNRSTDNRVQLAGFAFAGTRGIKKVEVSVDGGDSWEEAELSQPLEGESVWRQWKYEWEPDRGKHVVIARATDGEGNLQPREKSQPYPSGPTGWVSKTVNI